jgi:small-conductance mechanosensitive channel
MATCDLLKRWSLPRGRLLLAACLLVVSSSPPLGAWQPPAIDPAAAAQTAPPAGQPAPPVPEQARPASAGPSQPPPERPAGVPVTYRGREVLRIYTSMGAMSPEERATLAAGRIDRLVNDISFRPELATVVDRGDTSEIVIGDRVLGVITADDARVLGKSTHEFAEETLARVRQAIIETREEMSFRRVVTGVATAIIATLILLGALWLLRALSRRLQGRVARWQQARARGLEFHRLELVSAERIAELSRFVLRVAVVVGSVFLVLAWLESVLGALPWTRPYAAVVIDYLEAPVGVLWDGVVTALPNAFYLLVIAALAYGLLKAVHFFFREIERGTIVFANFQTDWAEPTYKLVRVLIIALAFVAAFPYIPGSQSPAFQGVSLFIGLLVSLSSSSAISNIIAGALLTYTGAFRMGDIVKIGDSIGAVVEKTLLVTRLRTPKNVVVSVPNATVLATQVLNYSALAAKDGLRLHTSVTIGYDAPWRRVHELLLEAAAATDGVLQEPAPFVLQTALNDFYVSYELNVYTRQPTRMLSIYSDLHANIQDTFNRDGVEIMSPHYTSLRDGNTVTIPEGHRAADYEAPPFRISDVGRAAETRRAASAPRAVPAARNEG